MKSGSLKFPEPSGPVQACTGIILRLYFFRFMSIGEFFRITDVCIFLVCNFFLGKPVFDYNCFIVMVLVSVWQLRTKLKHAAHIDVTNKTNENPLFPLIYDTQVLQACG
jgi:hypothetical protein